MKHSFVFSSALCLTLGLLCGILIPFSENTRTPVSTNPLPAITANTPQGNSGKTSGKQEKLDPRDSATLLNTACLTVSALKSRNYVTLASYVHPQKGVTFTPFSTVRLEKDINLSSVQISQLERDRTTYVWGERNGSNSLIELTIPKYFDQFVFDRDYTKAPRVGIDEVVITGNALENLPDAYPGCRFVDFTFPAKDPGDKAPNWSSLKLVFEPGEYQWYLVGIIHSQWTV